ncbi:MAG: glutaredoxin 3 [Candidatus Endobugula sp.]|jgi:glutaredoxin 3
MSVIMYTTRYCPFCVRAKQLFDEKKIVYKEMSVDNDPLLRQEMMKKSGQRTVPQIWINNKHIGGCDDLFALQRSGQLEGLLIN